MDFSIKPSEALRRGRATYPPYVGRLFGEVEGVTRACALGAIWAGFGGEPRYMGDPTATEAYFEIYDTLEAHGVPMSVANFNDEGWSDEDIIAWLEDRGQ